MRNSSRAIQHPCYSVITNQSLAAKIAAYSKKKLWKFLHTFITTKKEIVEMIVTILFTGSLLLSGTYLFLSQLAQHGW